MSKFEPEFSIGIYPLLDDDTCYFVVIDFDETEWQEDIKTVIKVAIEHELPFIVEKSQSGNGAHLCFFFEEKTSAYKARRMATLILNLSMNRSKSLTLKSYGRIFPTQDTLSKDGIGNLIALPLDAKARQNKNSIFLDYNLNPIDDDKQWDHLATTKKIDKHKLDNFLNTYNTDFEYNHTENIDKQDTVTLTLEEGLKI